MAAVAGVSKHNKTSVVFPAPAFVFLICGGVIGVVSSIAAINEWL